MTRINTNVGSLNAQKTLARSNAQLQQSLTRLSTGLRINSGKDDPAGLIASEALRSDIVSTQVAVSNSERANQMITTADSALGQVSSLLNDVRGLVSEAANVGAMSTEQIEANQLQVDSSLEAIDRIAQVTQFQGKRLLDGSLDFITDGVASTISDLQIQQANFGTQSEIAVSVNVVAQAEKGSLTYASSTVSTSVVLEIGGANGFEAFDFASGSTIAEMAAAINLVSDALGIEATVANDIAETAGTGNVTLTSVGDDNDIVVTADTGGEAGGNIDIVYNVVNGGADTTAVSTANADGSQSITVNLMASDWATASGTAIALGGVGTIDLTADAAGTMYNDIDIEIVDAATGNQAVYDHANKKITVTVDISGAGANDSSDVTIAINADLGNIFTASDNAVGAVVGGATYADVISGGTDAGTITSTATQVMAALNDDVGALVTAALATDNDGTTAVTALTQSAYLGSQNTGRASDTNNYLQFLGPDTASGMNIAFAAGSASQSLSIALVENTVTNGQATATIAGAVANSSFTVTANTAGEAYNDITVVFDDTTGDDPPKVLWDQEAGTLTIQGDFETGGFTADEIIAAINTDAVASAYFTAAEVDGDGTGVVDIPATGATATMGTLAGGNEYTGITVNLATDANGTVTSTAADLIALVAAGGTGFDTLGLSLSNSGTSDGSGLLLAGSTTVSSTAGVDMLDNYDVGDELNSTSLTFTSTEYGSNEFVSVKALEGSFAVTDADDVAKTRDSGTDINLRLNGIQAVGKGLSASINTSALDVSFSLASSVVAGTEMSFTITDGGAQFQLGPDVVSNQQARMGIASINTAKLGGTSGQLFQLRSGGDYDLTTDTKVAAKIVEQAISSVTTLRGRLGAFQSTTLQSNIDVLNDTLESLTTAESTIRDADFAAESAALTRAQILVQSGISVLSMANQNPQNVLALLR